MEEPRRKRQQEAGGSRRKIQLKYVSFLLQKTKCM